MRIGVLVTEGCFDSALAVVLDVLRAADRLRGTVDPAIPPFDVRTVGVGETDATPAVRTGAGLSLVPDLGLDDDAVDGLDLLVVPGLGSFSEAALVDRLAAPDIRRIRRRMVALHDEGVDLAAACTGTFVLGEAGILDGRPATTTWWLSRTFAGRYPGVDLRMERMVVHAGPSPTERVGRPGRTTTSGVDRPGRGVAVGAGRTGGITTAGAAFAHVDLAISVVSSVSPRLADVVARYLLIDPRPAAGIEAAVDHLATSDALVSEFEEWVRANLGSAFTIGDAAAALGVTRRTLERHCRERTSRSPNEVVRRLRAERARHLRRTTDLSFDQIAPLVGYRHAATVRGLLRGGADRGPH
jgi:transcriptional regulator GlxA family with amidase domain